LRRKNDERLGSLSRVNRIEWQKIFRNAGKGHPDPASKSLYQNRNVMPTWLD